MRLKGYGWIKAFKTAAKNDSFWFEAKQIIIRQVIRAYLKHPSYILSATA